MVAPLLVFGYGNPGRGDDALGPLLLERIDALRTTHPEWPELELLTDFQLQVEHVLDLAGRERVLFVDADAALDAPFSFTPIQPVPGTACTTHAMAPQALLDLYGRVLDSAPPPAHLLAIRGDRFGLGDPLTPAARSNLDRATVFLTEILSRPWAECAGTLVQGPIAAPGGHELPLPEFAARWDEYHPQAGAKVPAATR